MRALKTINLQTSFGRVNKSNPNTFLENGYNVGELNVADLKPVF